MKVVLAIPAARPTANTPGGRAIGRWLARVALGWGWLAWLPISGWAQGIPVCPPNSPPNATGSFVVNTAAQNNVTRVCVGTPVTLVAGPPTAGGAINNLVYNFNATNLGAPLPNVSPAPGFTTVSYTYATPGRYVIAQGGVGNAGSGITCVYAARTLEVLATPPPVFSVSLCNSLVVRLDIPSPAQNPNNVYDNFLVDWGDGTPIAPVQASVVPFLHQYGSPGPRVITVTGQYVATGCGTPAPSQTIQPQASFTLPTFTRVQVLDTTSVELSYQPAAGYVRYEIQQRVVGTGYGPGLVVTGVSGPQRFRVGNLTPQTTDYCFRVLAADACGIEFDLGEICTVRTQVSAQNRQNQVQWQQYAGPDFEYYELFKNDQSLVRIPVLTEVLLRDTQVQCGRRDCYRLEVKAGTTRSVGLPVCVTARSDESPPAVADLSATIQPNGQALLTWSVSPRFAARNFVLSRSANGAAFAPLTQVSGTRYLDPLPPSDTTRYCYRIAFTDLCGNTAPVSAPACPIRLRRAAASAPPYALAWTPYTAWASGVRGYAVELLDSAGNLRQRTSVGAALNYNDPQLDTTQQRLYFRVRAFSNDNLGLEVVSNVVEIRQELRLFLPTAFTPNEDGLNETFVAKGLFIRSFRMEIFNRWGQQIFVADRLEDGWDGKLNDSTLPNQIYVVKVTATDFLGRTVTRTQRLTLLR